MMMAKRGLYKYRWHKDRNFVSDLAVMTLGVFLAGLAVFGVVRLSGTGWFWGGPEAGEETLRGAAEEIHEEVPEQEIKQPVEQISFSDLSAKISLKGETGYAYVGQNNVQILKFELTTPVSARLKHICFSVDGYAGTGDITSLQLYYENMLAGQAPVTDAEAIFDRIDIPLDAGRTASFLVKANIGPEAKSGDRVNVGITDASDIMLVDESAILIHVDTDFPLWGGLTSIIGNKIRK